MAAGDVTVDTLTPISFPCAKFDGVDDYVSFPDLDLFSFGNGTIDFPFSITAWVKTTSALATNQVILGKYQSPFEYYFHLRGTDTLPQLEIRDQSAAVNCACSGTTGAVVNIWVHVAATYNGVGGATAGNGIKIYTNGLNVTGTPSNNAAYVAMENGTSISKIGLRSTPNTQPFKGFIRDVRIYNRVLSSSEITRVSNSELITDGLIGHWKLDGDADDSSGNGNNGTDSGNIYLADNETIDSEFTTARVNANSKYYAIPLKASNSVMTVHIEEA